MRYFIVASFIFLLGAQAQAQQVIVRGGFLADSAQIGEGTRYYLTARYPSALNILFPDSTYAFAPFEYESHQYFPTNTRDSISYDSAVYTLSTFEVDRAQALALPVFSVSPGDTAFYRAQADTILITQLVAHVPDSIPADKLPLKENTAYEKVPSLLNYPLIAIIAVVLVVIALIVFLVFGKRIRKHYRLKRLQRNHEKFVSEYNSKLEKVRVATSVELTESTLATWKQYLEQLESRPYTKLTTRETMIMEKDEKLGNILQAIDRAIYGHEGAAIQPLTNLREYADKKFTSKLEEVKHGK